jgi:hypothetical protein
LVKGAALAIVAAAVAMALARRVELIMVFADMQSLQITVAPQLGTVMLRSLIVSVTLLLL